MFIEPGADVYEGMIVGENNIRFRFSSQCYYSAKQLTNCRSADQR